MTLATPPSEPVTWLCYERVPNGARPSDPVRVSARLWYEARQLGAVKLGVGVEKVEAVIEQETHNADR